jgi:hypothetical protein
VDPFIRSYAGALDPFLCESIVRKFDQDERRAPGQIGLGQSEVKRSVDLEIRSLPDWEYLCRPLDQAVSATLRRYREDVPNFVDSQKVQLRETGYQVQCYQPNGSDGFDWHADVADRRSAERVLAMIAYLNDVEAGGETEFRAQAQKVAPRRGTILWFPPTFPYLHRGTAPVSGPKYVITCFLVYP